MPVYGSLKLKALADGRQWELLERIAWSGTYKGEGCVIVVPAGFVTNLASVPRIFWRIAAPATGKHKRAAVFHDWLYGGGVMIYKDVLYYLSDTEQHIADGIFYTIMREDGVPSWRAWLMRTALKIGGHAAWMRRS